MTCLGFSLSEYVNHICCLSGSRPGINWSARVLLTITRCGPVALSASVNQLPCTSSAPSVWKYVRLTDRLLASRPCGVAEGTPTTRRLLVLPPFDTGNTLLVPTDFTPGSARSLSRRVCMACNCSGSLGKRDCDSPTPIPSRLC